VQFAFVHYDFTEATPGCWRARRKTDVLPFHGDEWVVLPDGTVAIVRAQDYHVDWLAPDGTKTSTPKMPFDWLALSPDVKQHMIDSAQRVQDSTMAARPLPPNAPPGYKPQEPPLVSAGEIPDYYPSLRLGSVKVDLQGNLWIPPATSRDAKGGVLYDVVNRKGQVIDRVQLPAGRAVVAFARDGIILMAREGRRAFVEKAKNR